jgi:hypothetical protein
MPSDWSDAESFIALLSALREHLDKVIVVGGWAQRLFRLHPLARRTAPAPIATLDADLVLTNVGSRHLDLDHALTAAGFRAEEVGLDTPRVTHYYAPGGTDELHVEFLVPRIGGGTSRRGSERKTVEIAGVGAQLLPHLDVLIDATWWVLVDSSAGYGRGTARYRVRIPNAARYIVQKLLVLDQRSARKQPNDVRYLHDTIQTFGDSLSDLAELGAGISWTSARKKRLERGRIMLRSPDLLARASKIPDADGATLTPTTLAAVLELGLDRILGGGGSR